VILKILESYHSEFSKSDDTSTNVYLSEFLPLALEFYVHHVNSSDLILVNSLIRYLNVYFPNLDQSRFLVTKEEHVQYFEGETLAMGNVISKKSGKKRAMRNKNTIKIQGVKHAKYDLQKYV